MVKKRKQDGKDRTFTRIVIYNENKKERMGHSQET